MFKGFVRFGFAAAVLAGAMGVEVQAQELEITLENGSERERATERQLRRILTEYDVARWIYTTRIHIKQRQIPHSHPILTLSTASMGDDHGLLTMLVHEQFHWLEEDRSEAIDAAMAEFGTMFPDAPSGGPQGARDQSSTYLHLVVCDLEYQAMTLLVGRERAREIMSGQTHYMWIYDQVLHNPAIRQVNERHGFVVD